MNSLNITVDFLDTVVIVVFICREVNSWCLELRSQSVDI